MGLRLKMTGNFIVNEKLKGNLFSGEISAGALLRKNI
jgi:hypothetical protein